MGLLALAIGSLLYSVLSAANADPGWTFRARKVSARALMSSWASGVDGDSGERTAGGSELVAKMDSSASDEAALSIARSLPF